jgi:hypothetical protein
MKPRYSYRSVSLFKPFHSRPGFLPASFYNPQTLIAGIVRLNSIRTYHACNKQAPYSHRLEEKPMPPIARPVATVMLIAIVIVGGLALTVDTPSVPVISMMPTTVPIATSTPIPTALPTSMPIPTAQPTQVAIAAEPTAQPNPCTPIQLSINGELNGKSGQLVSAKVEVRGIVNGKLDTPDHTIGVYPDYHPTLAGLPGLGKLSFFDGHLLTIDKKGAPLANLHATHIGDPVIIQCSDGSSLSRPVQKILTVASAPEFRKENELTYEEAMIELVKNLNGETYVIATCAGEGFTIDGVYSKTHRTIVIAY